MSAKHSKWLNVSFFQFNHSCIWLTVKRTSCITTVIVIYQISQQRDMIHSRLAVSILFLVSFFAYYLYRYKTVMIELDIDRDDGNYNPLLVTQHLHRSSNFFNCERHHGYRERTECSDRNMIGAQIYSIRDCMHHDDSSTIVTRQDIPNIIPPLPLTGCENLEDGPAKTLCEVNVQKIITIAACVGAGLVIVPALFFIAWTLATWIRVVRPRKETILIGKEAKKKAAGQTWRNTQVLGGGQIQELVLGKEAYISEGNAVGAGVKKVRPRIEEKEVWCGGVRMTMPWGRGENWSGAVSCVAGLLIKRTDKCGLR